MNISEFDRTKPRETMKALNALIKDVKSVMDVKDVPDVFWYDAKIEKIHNDLLDIRQKLKNGD